MENPKEQFIERIKTANNVLVTVSANPTVDQLSAAIGLTLMLNKMGKHATAVYSGNTPSTIEFLQPEKTLEKNTDSLRDFIIALDKSKADKLRYKVEDEHVKIFITPYKTSISDKDLDFSQGDFNVEVVVALGVTDPKDLDEAITAHGRILHDATTISVTTGQSSTLGSINWADAAASSLCEMISSISNSLQGDLLDGQMATALMTGIVAETKRFSNEKTTPAVMTVSAQLMAAGANQQLVASKLQEGASASSSSTPPEHAESEDADGSLQIEHPSDGNSEETAFVGELPDLEADPVPEFDQIDINASGEMQQAERPEPPAEPAAPEPQPEESQSMIEGSSSPVLEPPMLGGRLTANTETEQLDPSLDPLSGRSNNSPLLSHDTVQSEDAEPSEPLPDLNGTEELPGPTMTLPSEAASQPDLPVEPPQEPAVESPTLTSIEESVGSPHLEAPVAPEEPQLPPLPPIETLEQFTPPTDDIVAMTDALQNVGADTTQDTSIDDARDAITAALANTQEPLPPISALNAQPMDLEIRQTGETGILDHADQQPPMPDFTMPTAAPAQDPSPQSFDAIAPPPVPPPMMPPDFDANVTLPSMPGPEPTEGDPNNPFNLPPA